MKKIIITNDSSAELRLILEPWGDEFMVRQATTVEILATGATENYLEIRYVERGIAVFGWSGGILTVTQDGKELIQCSQTKLSP